MVKALLVGAGIFLAGLVLGVVLLGQGGSGAVAGPEVSFPVRFNDKATFLGEVTLGSGNCGTKTYIIGALGVLDNISTADFKVSTNVSIAGMTKGDSPIVSWSSASPTSTLFALGYGVEVEASTTEATVTFFNLSGATSTAINASGTIKVCYFD